MTEHRYLAFAWPAGGCEADAAAGRWAERLAHAADWVRTLRRPGLEIWTSPERGAPVRPLAGGAVVIGRMLDRRSGLAAAVADLPARPLEAARRLRDETWGGYLALLPDRDGGLWAYREPSGALDAFAWRLGPVTAVSDDVQRLPAWLAPADLALDWDAIAAVVADSYATGHLSTLAGYRPIPPGAVREWTRPGASDHQIWTAHAHAVGDLDPTPAELRGVVVRTVAALAEAYPRLVVDVSGGLDSAVVAAALVSGGHRSRVAGAVNYYAAERAGDERAWAEAVTRRLGLPFVAAARCAAPLTEADFAELAKHVGPALSAVDVDRDRDAERRAAALGATALFGGQGGDALFFRLPTGQVVGDLVRARGFGALADPLVHQWPRWLRRSVWSVLAEAAGRPRALVDGGWSALLGPRARAGPPPPHPWLADAAGLPLAKRLQIQAVVGASHHHWGRARRSRSARVIHPLLAQPILELCLGTPTWRLVAGGRDRALARAAFAADLPAEVVDRRSKGALSTHYARRVASSLDFLRPHLLDGVLVGAGVLDHAAVEAALTPHALMTTGAGARLTRAALVESWARYWQTQAPDLARAARR